MALDLSNDQRKCKFGVTKIIKMQTQRKYLFLFTELMANIDNTFKVFKVFWSLIFLTIE